MGNIAGNTARLIDVLNKTAADAPDLLVFSELFIQGYPPRDLLEQPWFIAHGNEAIKRICAESLKHPDTGILFGCATQNTHPNGKGLSNSAILVCNGIILLTQDKSLLPTYDVFDESRYFDAAQSRAVVNFKDERLGITICEDAWNVSGMWDKPLYDSYPVCDCAQKGATLIINLSASPYHLGKERMRLTLAKKHARRHGLPFILVNQTGGNDELIFDGASIAVNSCGDLCCQLPSFTEAVQIIDTKNLVPVSHEPAYDPAASAHDALVCGLSDYMRKCRFTKAIIGLSGGIDSAVTAALAVAALGPQNVWGVTMPSRFSSGGSIDDSEQLAKNLGIRFSQIPIEQPFSAFLSALAPSFENRKPDLSEENIQARTRGVILMALSNKFGHLLLSTGNKSELAVGYCTLYGDMNGGLSVISDLPKTMVYKVANYINRDREIIPQNSITKPPSAELRPDQKDQDTLPPYDILDAIIELAVEEKKSATDIAAAGFDKKTVVWVLAAIAKSEYKRRQAAPGLKLTPKAFGSGRRFPLAAHYEY